MQGNLATNAIKRADFAEALTAYNKFFLARYISNTLTRDGRAVMYRLVEPIPTQDLLIEVYKEFVGGFMRGRGWRTLPGIDEVNLEHWV